MKNKSIYLISAIVTVCMLLVSCTGTPGRIKNATENKDVQETLVALEEGRYQDAQELFEEKIQGNIHLEQEAKEALPLYIDALFQDVYEEKASPDSARCFAKSASRAGFEKPLSLLWYDYRLDHVLDSLNGFKYGMEQYEAADYSEAVRRLSEVSKEDPHYSKAMKTLMDIGNTWQASENFSDWKQAVNVYNFLYDSGFVGHGIFEEDSWTRNYWEKAEEDNWGEDEWDDDEWSDDEWTEDEWTEGEWTEGEWIDDEWAEDEWDDDFPIARLDLHTNQHDTHIKIAEYAESTHQLMLTAAEYANAAEQSWMACEETADRDRAAAKAYLENSEKEKNQYIKTLRDLNCVAEDPLTHTFYVLTENGVEYRGDDQLFNTSRVLTQLLFDPDYGSYGYTSMSFGSIDTDGYTSFGTSEENEDSGIDHWQPRGRGLPINMYLDNSLSYGEIDAAVLYSDGNISRYGMEYGDKIDQLTYYGPILDYRVVSTVEHAVLAMDGTVHISDNDEGENSWFDQLSDITAISAGWMNPTGETFTSRGRPQQEFVYALQSDGTIWFGMYRYNSEITPVYGCFTPEQSAVMIAANVYMTADGKLHSMDPQYDPWLQAFCGDRVFELITDATPKSDASCVAAKTTEGEILIIDLTQAIED